MSQSQGPHFVRDLIEAAFQAAPMYAAAIDNNTCWERLREQMLQGGIRPDTAAATRLVEAAGFLACTSDLPGVCPDCPAIDLVESGILLGSDKAVFHQALGVASTIAIGIAAIPARPEDVSKTAWLRATYAVAQIAYRWSQHAADAHDQVTASNEPDAPHAA